MVDAFDKLIVEYLQRLGTKLDRVTEDIADLKIRRPRSNNESLRLNCRLRVSTATSIESKRGWIASSDVSIWSNRRIEVMI
jgi:hypothetical protein